MKKRGNIGLIRFSVIIFGIFLQICIFGSLVYVMKEYAVYLYTAFRLFGLVKVLDMNNKDGRSPYTKFWTIIILLIPVFGELLYMFWGRTGKPGRRSRSLLNRLNDIKPLYHEGIGIETIDDNIYKRHTSNQEKLHRFLHREGFPLYINTSSTYIPDGRTYFERLFEDLKEAKRYIFLEYHIIEHGEVWNELLEILKERASNGVEIKLIYDDIGSLSVHYKTMKSLKEDGIDAIAFNQIRNVKSSLYANYRNHQRIVVIDGYVAYTGGINITDKYRISKKGEDVLKDSAIRIEGDAVYSMTYIFLQMWHLERPEVLDVDDFKSIEVNKVLLTTGLYQPFSDGPLNNPDNPAEKIYQQIIANANDYIYITSPYLNLDSNMRDYLCTAARSGVDVRIIIPRKYDRPQWKTLTNANLNELVRAGVKVYRYLPGHIHSKTIIADGDLAILGTINMNYRSFYLHFENGVFTSDELLICDIKDDLEEILINCELVMLDEIENKTKKNSLNEALIKSISPLL